MYLCWRGCGHGSREHRKESGKKYLEDGTKWLVGERLLKGSACLSESLVSRFRNRVWTLGRYKTISEKEVLSPSPSFTAQTSAWVVLHIWLDYYSCIISISSSAHCFALRVLNMNSFPPCISLHEMQFLNWRYGSFRSMEKCSITLLALKIYTC